MYKRTPFVWLFWISLCGAVSTLHGQPRALELKLGALKEEFALGEPLAVRVTLTNVSARGVYLFRTLHPDGLLVRFSVRNETGQSVYESPVKITERTHLFVQDTFLLDPGYQWGATFKLSDAEKPDQPARYSPGRYRISAVYTNQDADGKGGTLVGTFRSNTVGVRVRGAQ